MTQALTVGLVARIFINMPVWAAQHIGAFEREGLEVTAEVLYGVQNVTDAVRTRRVDIGIGTPESVLSDPGGPDGLVIVAGNARKLNNGLIAARGITSVEQLRGRTIGVSHAQEGTALLVAEMLASYGLRSGVDYQIKAIGVASKRWEEIQQGTLDAGLQTPPDKYIGEDEGYANLGDISDYVPDYQFTTVNVRRDWAAQSADALTAFLRALAASTQWLYDEPAAAVELAGAVLQTIPDYAQRDYDHFIRTASLPADLSLSPAGMAKVVQVMGKAGTLASGTRADDRVDLSYLNAATPHATTPNSATTAATL